ncbi:unnamed protein product [Cercospora beticola]|nr:unnamed protein product [Cercospora beticola]
MRFLEVDDGDGFRLTRDFPENDISRTYAVLSHTWGEDGDEVIFQDMQQGGGTDKPGFGKIRFCAERAQCDGIKYFWIDTCCINKNNQFELSKSIISMFRWYQRAEKCYVYLSDVPRDSKEPIRDTEDWEKDFCESRWFKRGWTLQELLAPASVEFFSRHGVKLGDKAGLERQIREVTNIPVAALRGRPLSSFTKHERFSWQRSRQTKEEEDIVYSLIGIFDVSIPVLYGEGRDHARTRLDREIDISRKGPDHESFSVTFASPEVAETAHFVARVSELREIHEVLSSSGVRRGVTIHGLGGMGKTQLAIAYAMQYKDDYSAVFWVNAKDEDSLKLSFGNIAKQIAREHPSADAMRNAANSSDRDEAVNAVKRWLNLANNTRWLIIYDNYDNPKIPSNTDSFALDLRKYVPESHQGCLIVTTRSSEVRFGQQMRIRKLETIEDSLAILSHSCDRSPLADDPDAVKLAKKLDGLPLALATAGAYLRQTSMTFTEYCNLYQASWAKLQQTSPSLDSYEDKQLYSTWQISFDQIQQRNEAAAQLLRLWAYFDNEDIWYELLCYKHAKRYFPAWLCKLTDDELDFNSAVRVLCDHGIVDAHPPTRGQTNGYSMHSCVHSWTRDVLNAEPDEHLARTALFCVANFVPNTDSAEWWVIQRRLFNHANRQLHGHASVGDDASWACYHLGVLYQNQGKLADAEEMYNRALPGHERKLGPDHESTLLTVCNLSVVYKRQGKLAEAEKMCDRALQSAGGTLGPEHMLSLSTVHNLGDIYRKQGKLVEAEKLYERVLQRERRTLGLDHSWNLATVNNLGLLYVDQGKLAEAEKIYDRALQGGERALGLNHPSTLDTVCNLGTLYASQGKLVEAERMCQRALQGYEMALGLDHLSTLDTVHNLGLLYEKQGKLVEVEEMYQRALQGSERALGPDHPSTLETVHNLGCFYRDGDQGKLVEAEKSFQQALQGFMKALGPDHPSTLATVFEIGRLYAKQRRRPEAEQMYHRLVAAQDNLSTDVRDEFAIFEQELRALGVEKIPLRRLQGSSSSKEEDDLETTDQSRSDEVQSHDGSRSDDSQTSDQGAIEVGRASRKRQFEEPQESRKRLCEVPRVPDQRRYNLRTTRPHSSKK